MRRFDPGPLQSKTTAVLWFHHRLNEWAYHLLGFMPTPVEGAGAWVFGLDDGDYEVARRDTDKGTVTERENTECRDGELALSVPTVAADVASVIRRL